VHFGYGQISEVDSIKVIWPDGKVRKLSKVKTNQTLILSPEDGEPSSFSLPRNTSKAIFQEVAHADLGLTFEHVEDSYSDFNRLKLLPYQQSDRGPATTVGDINNDGMLDVFFGGSKYIPGQFFIQTNSGFVKSSVPSILKDSIKEDVEAVIEDFDKDGKSDLFLASGGADFYGKSKPLLDGYYRGDGSGFTEQTISDYYENASCLRKFYFDGDGDLDLFV
jgi:hypothetical protein